MLRSNTDLGGVQRVKSAKSSWMSQGVGIVGWVQSHEEEKALCTIVQVVTSDLIGEAEVLYMVTGNSGVGAIERVGQQKGGSLQPQPHSEQCPIAFQTPKTGAHPLSSRSQRKPIIIAKAEPI